MMENEWLLKVCIIGSDSDLNYQFNNLTVMFNTYILRPDDLATLGIEVPEKVGKIRLRVMLLVGHKSFRKYKGHEVYEGPSGCLILFDKGKNETFLGVTDCYRAYMDTVTDDSTPIASAIVGIKTDKEEITFNQGQQLVAKLNTMYYETSIMDKEQVSRFLREWVKTILKDIKDQYCPRNA
jgi:hypothetical protein